MGRKAEDFTGRRIGMLVVTERAWTKQRRGHCFWHCRCDCGNEKVLPASSLRGGNVVACGCQKNTIGRIQHLIETTDFAHSKLLANRHVTTSGCWEWMGSRNEDGYGTVAFNDRTYRAHRAAYHLWVGDIPRNYQVCHHCDNPPCFNPAHLFVGTAQDNSSDMVAKGRSPRTRGATSGRSKLTDENALAIKAWLKLGARQADIALFFGVARPTITSIKSNQNWGYLNEEG